MVILRDLNDEEEESSVIPPLGFELELRIRSHCTRRDGTVDVDRYFTEMLDLPIIEDDSSSESSDNDCFIIPHSSFTGKELVLFNSDRNCLPIVEMLTTSKYHSLDSIQTLRGAVKFSGSGREGDVITEPVGVDDLVMAVNTSPPYYFLMYGVVVQTFNLWFPFEIICLALGIPSSHGVFFSFYYIKSFAADRLVSLCSQSNRSLFLLYAKIFKNYQDSFYRVRGVQTVRMLCTTAILIYFLSIGLVLLI
jgi:hypothetical protein